MNEMEAVSRERPRVSGRKGEKIMVRRSGMSVFEDAGLLTIEIAPSRRWSEWGRDACLVALWAFIAVAMSQQVTSKEASDGRWIPVCALLTLCVLCLFGASRLVWQFWGIEEIVLEGEMLKRILRLGLLAWSENYPVAEVRDLHPILACNRFERVIGGSLAFYCQDRMRLLADRLSPSQARDVVRVLRAWLPATNWTPVLGI
jgi:hypothetical protein